MTLKPLFDKVVLKKVEAEETTKVGIILTGSAKEKPITESRAIRQKPNTVVKIKPCFTRLYCFARWLKEATG